MKEKVIFFTGFPGFIGKRLLEKMVQSHPQARFILLVEERFSNQAAQQLETMQISKAEIVLGDITKPHLGMEKAQWDLLSSQVTDVFHLAAIYDLAIPFKPAHKVNVEGTKNIIALCQHTQSLMAFVYFSTCYVAGKSTGTFYEDDLPPVPGFKNHYEATKYEAEQMVRQYLKQIPTIIIRPSIVVGDSLQGETQKFDGPFFGMIMIDRLKKWGIPIPYLGALRAKVNVVPVDFVVNATLAIWQNPKNLGKCYALADPNPIETKELYVETIKQLGARGPLGKVPPHFMEWLLSFKTIRNFLGVPRQILSYFNHDVSFDTTNATNALRESGISCPPLLSYFPKLVEFYQQNKHRKEFYWQP